MTKILIVDDNQEDLQVLESNLKNSGYQTDVATNGAEALDKLSEGSPDLILIDVKMPTLSGYDLVRLLREKLNGKIKMAYVTIVPEKDVNMENVDGIIQKPFTPENLVKKVKEILGE